MKNRQKFARSVLMAGVSSLYLSGAIAQSNVTVYGVADAGLEYSRAGTSLTRVFSGGAAGSRIGFRGVEDLGGGLSAVFRLEQGINIDTGTLGQGGRAFGREASVGLTSKDWGTVLAGRLPTPYYAVLSAVDAFSWMGSGGTLALTRTGAGGQQILPLGVDARSDNSVSYISPRWAGIEARALYTTGEKASTGTGNGLGASARYSVDALDAVVGYTKMEGPSGSIGDVNGAVIGGSYNLKSFKVFAGYSRERNSCTGCTGALARIAGVAVGGAADFRIVNIGVRVPFGALTAIAQVARVIDRTAYAVNPGDRDATRLGIGAEYAMSRRTTAYTSLASIGNRNGSLYALGSGSVQQPAGRVAAGDPRSTTLTMGVRHVF